MNRAVTVASLTGLGVSALASPDVLVEFKAIAVVDLMSRTRV